MKYLDICHYPKFKLPSYSESKVSVDLKFKTKDFQKKPKMSQNGQRLLLVEGIKQVG
jgi:hypothetical protein